MSTESNSSTEDVTVPATAYVPCPAKTFKNRQVLKCVECEHFRGFMEVSDRAIDFERKYRVVCAHPIARAMLAIEQE